MIIDKIKKLLNKLLKSTKKRFAVVSKFKTHYKKYKFVHLMHNDKFNKDLIGFFNDNFDAKEHLFIFCCGGRQEELFPIPKLKNVIVLRKFNSSKNNEDEDFLLSILKNAKKIILHGLFLKNVVYFLDKNNHLLKKCAWVMWGGDLYHYKYREKTLAEDAFEEVRKKAIGGLGEFITGTVGDYELAKKWYLVKGRLSRCFGYIDIKTHNYNANQKTKNQFCVLVGNSAAHTNNHLEILRKLEVHKEKISKIICPLSYGDSDGYVKNIISEGREIFGDKFSPMLDYMEKVEYEKMLFEEVDIAIFNHERQQAFTTLISLFLMQKKVYLNEESSIVETCNDLGLKIFLTKNVNQDDFFNFDKNIANKNKNLAGELFSKEALINSWRKIFFS